MSNIQNNIVTVSSVKFTKLQILQKFQTVMGNIEDAIRRDYINLDEQVDEYNILLQFLKDTQQVPELMEIKEDIVELERSLTLGKKYYMLEKMAELQDRLISIVRIEKKKSLQKSVESILSRHFVLSTKLDEISCKIIPILQMNDMKNKAKELEFRINAKKILSEYFPYISYGDIDNLIKELINLKKWRHERTEYVLYSVLCP